MGNRCTWRWLLRPVIVCLALLSAGCTSGSAQDAVPEPQPHDGLTLQEFGRSLREDAPLAIALKDSAQNPDRGGDWQGAREAWVLECLRDQGIVPKPTPTATADYSNSFWLLPDSMTEFEFIAKHGYGTTEWAKRLRIEDELLDAVNDLVPLPAIPNDPAEAGAQMARRECLRRAAEVDLRTDLTPRDVLQETFGAELQQLRDRVLADPRQEELRSTWRSCMAEAGHQWDSAGEIQDMLEDEIDTVQQDIESSSEIFPLLSLINEAELAPLNADQRRALLQNSGAVQQVLELPGVREELARVQALEVEIALADYRCSEGHYEIQRQIQFEAEQGFVDEHRESIADAVVEAELR